MEYGHFFEELRSQVEGDLLVDETSRILYSTDASNYEIVPLGVLLPKSASDIAAAVRSAAQFGVPVLARGGGSSLAGQTVGAALVIDCSRYMNRIIEVDTHNALARVEPGIILDTLNREVAPYGLMVGPDPASGNRATVGGMVANNATGTHSILYGNMIDHVAEAEVVLADGSRATFKERNRSEWTEQRRKPGLTGAIHQALDTFVATQAETIRRDTPKHWRRNSGYRLETLLEETRNLSRLLCGSEGTLAVMTEIVVSLVQKPKHTGLGIVHFRTRNEALEAVTTVLETDPSAVELMDGVAIRQARRSKGFASQMGFIEGDPGSVLITEYYGDTQEELKKSLADLADRVAKQSYKIRQILETADVRSVWNVRKEVLGLVMGVTGEYKPVAFIEDASVPVEHLAEYIRELDRYIAGRDTRVAYYAHASAGCLHVRPFLNLKEASEVDKMQDISLASMELVRRFGGSVASEHGDGLARSWLNQPFLGKALYDACVELKEIFDPTGILNPGKIVDAPEMTRDLRFGPDYSTSPVETIMDFSDFGGFAAAVEMCNGNGACRKLDTGTMCPSFMATRDEEDSTRGRANALRAALSGRLSGDSLTSRRMYEVMDLCIQCKGCKSECPSSVDMARIKTEWLGKYWEDNRIPFRTRIFATLPEMARRMTPPRARAVNWMSTRGISRWFMDRFFKISRERPFPLFARKSFTSTFAEARDSVGRPEVVLFPDTFANYLEPHVALSAAAVLERVGYHVIVPDRPLCCGRTYLSKGFVSDAQRLSIDTMDALFPYAERGLPIVGLEPSCILTLRDEFLMLLPGEHRARKVSERVVTFEEFVEQDDDHLFRDAGWRERPDTRVLIHGHCHQKVLSGISSSVSCLERSGYSTIEVVDAGCCGMAGAFGYEKEHISVSRAMAERRLVPAVEALPPDAIVAAAGTSCRAQIRDLTGRQALHPAEVMLRSLRDGVEQVD
ncbi:MAG: FAD-linked oxidase C-terminal domain-containing protein [Rhodothermales bacterium]|nr:FAD-linked oxidase C-terminal domain-containing protein [Rhodothermales bacterium]